MLKDGKTLPRFKRIKEMKPHLIEGASKKSIICGKNVYNIIVAHMAIGVTSNTVQSKKNHRRNLL